MPYRRPCLRPHAHRTLRLPTDILQVWKPDPDQRLRVDDVGDVMGLALAVLDSPVTREALTLIDHTGAVTAVLIDPPADVGLFVDVADLPCAATLLFVLRDNVPVRRPDDDDRRAYAALQLAHQAAGVRLLDVILTHPDRVQSLAMAFDDRAAWIDGNLWAA
jgi:hypothetical protein